MNTAAQNSMPEGGIVLTGESLNSFKKAMKTAYYKDMLKQGIINLAEFSKLMEIMNRKPENKAP